MKSAEVLQQIGHNISQIRKEKGIKGTTLGTELGISKAAVSQMENGCVDFKISYLLQIAAALNADLSSLLEKSNTINTKEELSRDYFDQIGKQMRVIEMLVCRIEYLNEQIECMKIKNAR